MECHLTIANSHCVWCLFYWFGVGDVQERCWAEALNVIKPLTKQICGSRISTLGKSMAAAGIELLFAGFIPRDVSSLTVFLLPFHFSSVFRLYPENQANLTSLQRGIGMTSSWIFVINLKFNQWHRAPLPSSFHCRPYFPALFYADEHDSLRASLLIVSGGGRGHIWQSRWWGAQLRVSSGLLVREKADLAKRKSFKTGWV